MAKAKPKAAARARKPARPRGARREIPKKRAEWEKEVMGVRHFIANIPPQRTEAGDRWANGMIAYYKERLRTLLANEPEKRKAKRG